MSPAPNPSLPATGTRTLIRARLVLRRSDLVLEDGAVLIAGDAVESVGPWQTLRSLSHDRALDLGEVILLPGIVNAHCHLDYTDMAGMIPPPRSFSDWIKAMLALKAHWGYSEFAASWIRGARMLLRNGITTVANIEAVPELLPEVRTTSPLRVCSLLEMTGVRSRRTPAQILQDALDRISRLPSPHDWTGLSPHAPYSTPVELLRLSGEAARRRRWLLAVHVAESREEFDMYLHAAGPMFEWLQPQRTTSECGQCSPVRRLHDQGLLGENTLAIHANYLAEGDVALLAESGASVVHCPRSHAYFLHEPFPRARLAQAGVNICLGTDSLATVAGKPGELELSMFAEMRALSDRDPGLCPAMLVDMATAASARALGLAGRIGELTPGGCADLIAIQAAGAGKEACSAVVQHSGPAQAVMIGGRWAVPPDT